MRKLSLPATLLVVLANVVAFATPLGRAHWIGVALAFGAVFVSGLVFISLILIPHWRRLDPKIYLEQFATFLPIAAPVIPLLGASCFVLAFAAFADQWHNARAPFALGVAINGMLLVLVLSLTINVPINMTVLRRPGSLAISEIVDLRKKWAVAHWARTVCALIALLALIAALDRQ
jgi:hypothetical protein